MEAGIKKDKQPKVSVVMSVYNGEKYIKKAIESILCQTFRDFEFIIINDGSTDNTLKIISKCKDSRIVLITRQNKGLVASLNEGIIKAKGEYIARQDADDYSDPERLEKQISKINKGKGNIVLIGTSMHYIGLNGNTIKDYYVLSGDSELRSELMIRNPFVHGSVIFKKQTAIQAGLYRKEFWPAEDYDLWQRLSGLGDVENLYEPLYYYRENNTGISNLNIELQELKKDSIQKQAITDLKIGTFKKVKLLKYLYSGSSLDIYVRLRNNYTQIYKLAYKSMNREDKFICKKTIYWSNVLIYMLRIVNKLKKSLLTS
jgi:glycosyltransferase involved in cell wall biosynthesis